ncbi:MAG: c-type cytochrome [Gammaproteobacteria bacterium]
MKLAFTIGRWSPALAAALVAMGLSGGARADELSDAIAAAEKASAAARKAASSAMSAASAARASNDVAKAANAAMDAGEAARNAAEAAAALAKVAKSATMTSEAATTGSQPAAGAPASESRSSASSDAAGTTQVATAPGSGAKPYADHVQCEARDCKIDLYLTKGFRAFSQCQVCHGLDANGSSFAPSLNEKMQEIDKARFVDVVTYGYKGQVGVMPPWESNPNVMKVLDNLYAYLMARSDKVVPPGKLPRYDR